MEFDDMQLPRQSSVLDARRILGFLAVSIVFGLSVSAAMPVAAQAVSQEALQRLEQTINQQQQQLQELRGQFEQLKDSTAKAQSDANQARATVNEAMASKSGSVISGQERIKLSISGQVNRMVNIADDDDESTVFHVDNENSSSRLRFVGTGKVNDDLTVGANIEASLNSNGSDTVSQNMETSGGTSFSARKVEVFLDSQHFGKLSIGQGSMASDDTAEVDLSGTGVIAYSSVVDLAGGLEFRNSATGELTGTKIIHVFNNFDGLGRDDRVRYDSPSFSGFKASASHATEDIWDVALTWGAAAAGLQIAAAGAYANVDNKEEAEDHRFSWSTSALHVGSGLSLTIAGGRGSYNGGRENADSLYLKAGWRAKFFDIGETAFSIDWSRNEDIANVGDEAESIGVYAVQNLDAFGTQFYGGVRNHELDRTGMPTDDLLVISVGSRVKF